jgi:hypothetical protein
VVFVLTLIFGVELWQDYRLFGREELIKEPIELLGVMAAFSMLAWYFTVPHKGEDDVRANR